MGTKRMLFRAVSIVFYWAIVAAFSFDAFGQFAPQTSNGFSSQNPGGTISGQPVAWNDPTILFLDGATASFISIDGDASFILSCGHGLNGVGDVVEGHTRKGQILRCQVVAWSHPEAGDAAILKFNGKAEYPARIAEVAAPPGSQLWYCGFPMGRQLTTKTMTAKQGLNGINIGVGKPIFGDSGGPVRNDRGEIVGVISGTNAYGATPDGQVYATGGNEGFYAQLKTIKALVNEVRQRGYVQTQCGPGGCGGGSCYGYGGGSCGSGNCGSGSCGVYYNEPTPWQNAPSRPSRPAPQPAIDRPSPAQPIATPAITAEHYESMKSAIEQLQRMQAAEKPCNCDPGQINNLTVEINNLKTQIANIKGCNCDPREIAAIDLRLTALESKCSTFKSCECSQPSAPTAPSPPVVEEPKTVPLPSTATPRLEGVIRPRSN